MLSAVETLISNAEVTAKIKKDVTSSDLWGTNKLYREVIKSSRYKIAEKAISLELTEWLKTVLSFLRMQESKIMNIEKN